MSKIIMVEIEKLKTNPMNKKYFHIENKQYFDGLLKDIGEHGIKVPLVAKQDGTLLAGHNRLLIADTLGIKNVPVQYVMDELTEKEEREYVIKDNLLRRHLSFSERKALYLKLYKNFKERIMIPGKVGITARKIAEDTGLNPKTVQFDLIRTRRLERKANVKKSEIEIANDKVIDGYKRAVARMLNFAILEKKSTVAECVKITELALGKLRDILPICEAEIHEKKRRLI
jgi:ParB-like chromosome segregation protein Spo0J